MVNNNDFVGHFTPLVEGKRASKRKGFVYINREKPNLGLCNYDDSAFGIFLVVFVFIVMCYSCVRIRFSLEPKSGTEKESRRELYMRKKASKKEAKYTLHVTNRSIVIPRVSKQKHLDDIYVNLPKFSYLEPRSGIDFKNTRFLSRLFKGSRDKELVVKIVALFESLSMLLVNIYQASSRQHQVCILLMWVQNRFARDKSLLLNMTDIICWFSGYKPKGIVDIIDKIKKVCSGSVSISDLFKGSLISKDEPIVLNPAAASEDTTAHAYAQSETVVRFKTLLQMFVDAGLCSIFGYSFDFSKGQKCLDWVNVSLHKIELVEYVSSTIMYFVKRGYAAYDKGSIRHLFFSDEWVCFEVEFCDVQSEMNTVFSGFHVGSAPCIGALRARILRLKEILRKQIPLAAVQHRKLLMDRMLKLNSMQKDLVAFDRKSGMRKAPVSLLAWGNSGVCKSWVSITLMYSILKHLGLPSDEYFVRTPNHADQFDSALDADTVGIILDDIANEKMEMLQSSPVEPLLRLINNAVAMANKASLEEKSTVFLEPQVVIANANHKTLNAHQFSIEQLSILRRLDSFIHVKMDPMYMSAGKSDLSKWPEENRLSGQPPLTFTVEKVSARDVPQVDARPVVNATYTHVPQVPVFNVVKWFDPVEKKDIDLFDIDFVTLERYCCHQAELKLRDQESFMRTVKRTANPLKCIHNNTYPYCDLCKDKIRITLNAIMRWRYIVKSRYTFAFTWRHGKDTPHTHKTSARPQLNRKLQKVELRRSMLSYVRRPFNLRKCGESYDVVFLNGRYQFASAELRRIKKAKIDANAARAAAALLNPSSDLTLPIFPWDPVPIDPALVAAPMSFEEAFPIEFTVFEDDNLTGAMVVDALRLLRDGPMSEESYGDALFLARRGLNTDTDIGDYLDNLGLSDSEDSKEDDDASDDSGVDRREAMARAYDELHHLDTGFEPRAGSDGVEECKDSYADMDLDACTACWKDMCDWWNHLSQATYITQIDVGLLDVAHKARTKLHYRRVMTDMPLDISGSPACVPAMSNDMFTFRRPPAGQMPDITNYYLSFRNRVLTAQAAVRKIDSDLDDDDDSDDDEESAKFVRFSWLLSIGMSRCLCVPFWCGDRALRCFKTKKNNGVNRAIVFNFTACLSACLLSLAGVLAVPSMFFGVVGSILVTSFWCIFSIASYVGIAHKGMIKWCNTTANACRVLASISRRTLNNKYAIIYGSLALVTIGAAYYTFKKKKEKPMEPSGSVVSTPIARVNERTNNYWVANKVSIEDSCGISGYQNTPDELLRTIGTQLVRVRIYPKEVRSISHSGKVPCETCCALTMYGGLLVLPQHIIRGKEDHLISVMRSGPGQVRNNANWIIPEGSIFCIEGTDIAFVHTIHLGAAKDLRMFLPKTISKDTFRVQWMLKEASNIGPFNVVHGTAEATYNSTTPVKGVLDYEGYNMKLYDSRGVSLESQNGWCMSVFVTQTNPSCLHSVYLAGKDHMHRSAPILHSYVDSAMDYFSTRGLIMLPSSGAFTPGKGGIVDMAGKRSPISHLDKCEEVNMCFDWLGASTEVGDFRRMSGRVRPTPFAPHLKEILGVDKSWGSPKNLGGWQPWYTNLINMGCKLDAFEPTVFEAAKADLCKSLLDKCSDWRGFGGETFSDVVHPVSEEVALNGVPGVSGCDRVKLNTSAGYPMNCPKKKVIEVVEDPKYPDGRLEPNQDIKDHTAYILDCAKKDVRSYVTFRASPKDEPTLPEKEKVRIFAGCPVAYLIAVRMYTCMLVKFMTDNHLLFNTVAGANAHDYDWTLAGKYLAEYSVVNLIAGDYSDYDKKLLALFMVAAVELTIEMLRLAGYTEEQLLIAKNLMLESCYCVYEWNGDFILVAGTNPSGQPLTVWLNNLANLLYQRYVFYTFYSYDTKFDDCVRILVMGDDNLMSVKEGYEKYNHTSIQEVLGSKGLAYTMADKSPVSKPYIPIEEVTLLKRRFVWSNEFEAYLCPIEEKSIHRCLHSHMLENGEKSEALRDHCMQMCDTALAEWFYFGETIYQDRLSKIKLLLNRVGMVEHCVRLLDYDQQCVRFKSRILKSRCLFGKVPDFKWINDFVEPLDSPIPEFLPSACAPCFECSVCKRDSVEFDTYCNFCRDETMQPSTTCNLSYVLEQDNFVKRAYEGKLMCKELLDEYRVRQEVSRLVPRIIDSYRCMVCKRSSLQKDSCLACNSSMVPSLKVSEEGANRIRESDSRYESSNCEFLARGGFGGYDLKPEYGFRELFFGRKIETNVEYWKVWNRRSLFVVDQSCGVSVWSVLDLFEQQCWIDTFAHIALGIHFGDFFEDDDPRLLYRRGDWALVIQDDELHRVYIRSLKAGVLSSITNC